MFTIELFYTSAVQQTMAYLGNNKQNFEITDGQDTYRVLQEGAISGAIKNLLRQSGQLKRIINP